MTIKQCTRCNETKPLSDFYKHKLHKDGRQTHCKACVKTTSAQYYVADPERRRTWNHKRRMRIREFLIEQKSKPCMDCKGTFPYYMMDFDHTDPTNKVDNVGSLATKMAGIELIAAEIAKCELVCSNCHRGRTWQRLVDQGVEYPLVEQS